MTEESITSTCSLNDIHLTPGQPTLCKCLVNGYEAVFISKLTCQLSSFFVQNFVQTTSTLCKQRQLCAKNDDHFVQTTTTLQGQRPLCTNNNDFVQTTTTLQGQRQLCQKFMYDPMKSPERLSPVCMAPWNFLRL